MHPKIPRRAIALLTAKAFDTTLEVLATSSRNQRHCKARWAIWHLVKEIVPQSSLSVLGDLIGGRDHTTVLHGLARATDLLATDEGFADRIQRARKLVAAWRPGSLPAPERVVPLVPVAKPAEPPSPVKYGAADLVSALRAERDEGSGYEIWRRMSCKHGEDRFLELARRFHPERVRVPQREAAE